MDNPPIEDLLPIEEAVKVEPPKKFVADPVMYIILRRDLLMPQGKACAQAAHAAVRLVKNKNQDKILMKRWFDPNQGNEAKVTLGCLTWSEFEIIADIAEGQGMCFEIIQDAAYTVFTKPTVTCIGIGPIERKHSHFFRHLRLY